MATGCFSLGGQVLEVSNINTKIRTAMAYGFRRIVIPTMNYEDVEEGLRDGTKIEVLQASTAFDLLNHCLIEEHSKSVRQPQASSVVCTLSRAGPMGIYAGRIYVYTGVYTSVSLATA
jgi:predicted ATP-dependent protease